ncbi:Sacsin [Geodia barretti]|uniref:Sacsin n=1 Tax=Geodia barretti TaxID=519541 RepID=A0AA35WE97_GEOBA|nr:Sacsin [Geodia barretti]
MKWNHNGPYLFKVPTSLDRRKYLKKALGIREQFDVEDMVVALRCLKGDFGENQLPDNCQELVKSIVIHMASVPLERDFGPVMLPDTQFILHEAKKLYHNDIPWAPLDDDYCYVHHAVPLGAAVALGVQLCRTASLAKYSVDSEFMVMEFGQHEDLTKRIQNIIRDYPFDMTILKELLQNADDAKATKMHVILDMREHSKENLLSENWSELQGPALLVWNDSVFSDYDLVGIKRLGLGSKRSDSETIGQYGIGFNAVYHLTDCPSFLTGGNKLCILDPHMRYVQHGTVKHPGEMYTGLDEKFWKKFDGIQSAYLRDGLIKVPKELLGGTLFRFPLRHTMAHVTSSEIVKDLSGKVVDRVISAHRMCDLLEDWVPNMKQSLLFLNNVVELKFSVIRDRRGVLHLQNRYRTELDETACGRRVELAQKVKAYDDTTTGGEPFITTYPLTLVETVKKGKDVKEEWLIQQGIGDMENSVKTWSYVEQVKPRHGIAAPLRHKRTKNWTVKYFAFFHCR